MDPQATLDQWADAVRQCDAVRAEAAALDLLEWIQGGGFPPRWTPSQECSFLSWVDERGYS